MTSPIVPVTTAPAIAPDYLRTFEEFPAGLSVAEIVDLAYPGMDGVADGIRVVLVSETGRAVVPPPMFAKVRPMAGVHVIIRPIPGDDATARNILLVAVSAAALYFAPAVAGFIGVSGAVGTSLVAAGLTVAGTLLVNTLVPPPQPDDTRRDPTYEISGWRNRVQPGEPIPMPLGRHRFAPPFAGQSWTEVVGYDQWVRALFCVGYGPLRISDIRIGDTPITDFDDVEVEVRDGRPTDQPVTLYPRQVIEEQFGVELVRPYPRDERGEPITPLEFGPGFAGLNIFAIPSYINSFGPQYSGDFLEQLFNPQTIEIPVVRWTASDVSEVSILFGMPGGLFRVNDEGKLRSVNVTIRIRARLDSVGDWIDVNNVNIRAKRRESFLRQFTWTPPSRGRWQLEFVRLTDEQVDDAISDSVYLASIQSIRSEYPINIDKPLAVIAVRIRASNQLNGALETLNALVEHEGPVFENGAWTVGYSRNPASAFLTALQGPGNPFPAADSEIDFDQVADWFEWCEAKGLKYDRVPQTEESLGQLLTVICAAGRASPRHDGVRWGVVIDRPQEIIVDHINPRNSAEFTWSRPYIDPPEGMRVAFLDETNNYRPSERVVPWPGHIGPVNLTESLELPGKTDPDEVWREARRRMYELIHRPDAYSAIQDGASRVVTRGDKVMGSFDVLDTAQIAGRVKAINGDYVVLDTLVPPHAGYGVRFRVFADAEDVIGTSVVRQVADSEVEVAAVRMTGSGPGPDVGDIVHIGPASTESLALRVRALEPAEDLASRILMIADAPQIDQLTDAEVPPVWDGRFGVESDILQQRLFVPEFRSITTGNVAGAGAETVEVLFLESTGSSIMPEIFELDHRLLGDTAWLTIRVPAADAGGIVTEYTLDDTIELRARTLTGLQTSGDSPIVEFDLSTGTVSVPPDVPNGAVTLTSTSGSVDIDIAPGPDTETAFFRLFRTPSGAILERAVHAITGPLASTPSTTVSYTDTVAAGAYDYYAEALNSDGNAGRMAGPFPVTVP